MLELINFITITPVILYILVGLLALCIGSFLNVVIYRTPKIMEQEFKDECLMTFQQESDDSYIPPPEPIIHTEKLTSNHTVKSEQNHQQTALINLSTPRSCCPNCQHTIRWYHNIPVLSWLYLKGKCADCQHAISIRYPLVEIITLCTSLIVLSVFGPTIKMLMALIFTWMLIVLTFIDFDTQLLPDRFTLTLAALGLAINSGVFHSIFSISNINFTGSVVSIWGYIIGFLSLWTVYYLFKLITGKEGMGYGDFKLLAALGAWVGVWQLPLIILFSSIIGVCVGFILLKIRKDNQYFAFGPYLAIAGWISLLWGNQIMYWYWGS